MKKHISETLSAIYHNYHDVWMLSIIEWMEYRLLMTLHQRQVLFSIDR
jgi:hypothetical protein